MGDDGDGQSRIREALPVGAAGTKSEVGLTEG
jgi:hypothetical protein